MKRLLPRMVLLSVCAADFGGFSATAASLDESFARELKSMAGTWRPIVAENNGYAASATELKGMTWLRDAAGLWVLRRGDEIVVQWTVRKVDASKSPKTIDLEVTSGSHAGTIYRGIYDFTDDTLRICLALPDRGERPTEFFAGKGSACALSVFKRERD